MPANEQQHQQRSEATTLSTAPVQPSSVLNRLHKRSSLPQ